MSLLNHRFSRRTILKGVLGTGIALFLPATLEETVEDARRVFALDRTMAATREILGHGYIVQQGALTFAVRSLEGIGATALVGTVQDAGLMAGGAALLGTERVIVGPVYITEVRADAPQRGSVSHGRR